VVGSIVVVVEVVDDDVDVDGMVVEVVVDDEVVEVVDVGVWAGRSGDDGPDEPLTTLAAAAVTPPATRALASAAAASLRAGTPMRVVPFPRPLACPLHRWRVGVRCTKPPLGDDTFEAEEGLAVGTDRVGSQGAGKASTSSACPERCPFLHRLG
jgi:hypothetical protein